MRNGGLSSSLNNIINKVYEDFIILFKYYNLFFNNIYFKNNFKK